MLKGENRYYCGPDNVSQHPLTIINPALNRKAYDTVNTNIKACVRYFLSNFYVLPNDSPLKTMKNVFYFI